MKERLIAISELPSFLEITISTIEKRIAKGEFPKIKTYVLRGGIRQPAWIYEDIEHWKNNKEANAVAKMVATRKKNIEARNALKKEAEAKKHFYADEIKKLEKRIDELRDTLTGIEMIKGISGRGFITESEIISKSTNYDASKLCGIYFLILNKKIVYIGQSVNIFTRIAEHSSVKKFDAFAYLPCEKDNLDKIESLYIHIFKPEQNGNTGRYGEKTAPLSWEEIFNI